MLFVSQCLVHSIWKWSKPWIHFFQYALKNASEKCWAREKRNSMIESYLDSACTIDFLSVWHQMPQLRQLIKFLPFSLTILKTDFASLFSEYTMTIPHCSLFPCLCQNPWETQDAQGYLQYSHIHNQAQVGKRGETWSSMGNLCPSSAKLLYPGDLGWFLHGLALSETGLSPEHCFTFTLSNTTSSFLRQNLLIPGRGLWSSWLFIAISRLFTVSSLKPMVFNSVSSNSTIRDSCHSLASSTITFMPYRKLLSYFLCF